MKRLKLYQSLYLLLVLFGAVAGNAWLAFNVQKTVSDINHHQSESTGKYQLIAQQSERIDFYNTLERKIHEELKLYRGRDIAHEVVAKEQNLTKEQRKAKAREEFLRRQRNRQATSSNTKEVHNNLRLNAPLPLSTPSYLHKITATPKDFKNSLYSMELDANTEYFRFLEWYSYFYTKYPFSMPKEIHMQVTDKKAYRSMPTEISISGKVDILAK